jgi:hypothetical protein
MLKDEIKKSIKKNNSKKPESIQVNLMKVEIEKK